MSADIHDRREPGSPRRGEEGEMGLAEYWYAVRSQWLLIAAVTVLVVVLALIATWLATPRYRATATLQIEREPVNVVNLEGVMPEESPTERDFYQTQYELLESRSLARRVIRRAELGSHPLYRDLAEAAAERAEAAPPEDGSPPPRQEAIERALTGPVLSALVVEPSRNSRLVRIHFDSPDPALSARVANAYAEEYIASNLERRMGASEFATRYLSERLAQLRDRVEESEKELVAYAGEQMIVPVGMDRPSLPAQNLSELNARLAGAQEARIRAEAAWRQAQSGNGLSLPQVVANPLIQNLRATRAQLVAEYQQKLATFKPDFPEMQRLKARMDEIDRQIATEVANIRRAIRHEYDAASQQESMMQAQIDRLKEQELDLQDRSIRYNMLKRDADTNRQIYDALLQRFKEIGVAAGVGANNVSVVDAADVPGRPYAPRLSVNLALGLLFGLFLGVALALIRYFLREPAARRGRPPREY